MKIHILGRNALNCALYLEFNGILLYAFYEDLLQKKIHIITYAYYIFSFDLILLYIP